MSFIGQAWRRFMFLLRRRQLDRDLAEELRQHAVLKAQKNVALGMDPEEAGTRRSDSWATLPGSTKRAARTGGSRSWRALCRTYITGCADCAKRRALPP